LEISKDTKSNGKKNDNCYIFKVPYLPTKDQDSLVFYGTQKFYVFLRFFYTLYERVLKAWELCQEFEVNEKTKNLTSEDKKNLAEERYNAFKLMLVHLLT